VVDALSDPVLDLRASAIASSNEGGIGVGLVENLPHRAEFFPAQRPTH